MKKKLHPIQKSFFKFQGTDGIRSEARLSKAYEKKEPLKNYNS